MSNAVFAPQTQTGVPLPGDRLFVEANIIAVDADTEILGLDPTRSVSILVKPGAGTVYNILATNAINPAVSDLVNVLASQTGDSFYTFIGNVTGIKVTSTSTTGTTLVSVCQAAAAR